MVQAHGNCAHAATAWHTDLLARTDPQAELHSATDNGSFSLLSVWGGVCGGLFVDQGCLRLLLCVLSSLATMFSVGLVRSAQSELKVSEWMNQVTAALVGLGKVERARRVELLPGGWGDVGSQSHTRSCSLGMCEAASVYTAVQVAHVFVGVNVCAQQLGSVCVTRGSRLILHAALQALPLAALS